MTKRDSWETPFRMRKVNASFNDKPHTVSEATDAVQRRHLDDEGKQVVNECVQGFVAEHAPRQMGHRLEFVIDEQLGGHHDEACNINHVINVGVLFT